MAVADNGASNSAVASGFHVRRPPCRRNGEHALPTCEPTRPEGLVQKMGGEPDLAERLARKLAVPSGLPDGVMPTKPGDSQSESAVSRRASCFPEMTVHSGSEVLPPMGSHRATRLGA